MCRFAETVLDRSILSDESNKYGLPREAVKYTFGNWSDGLIYVTKINMDLAETQARSHSNFRRLL
jgi:hypothetical protein